MKLQNRQFYQEIFLTSIAWSVLLFLIGWVLAAIGWYLLASLWHHELFVPESVESTAVAVILVTLWGVVVFVLSLVWAKFNHTRYFKHNKRKLEPPAIQAEPLAWSEMILAKNFTYFKARQDVQEIHAAN